MPKGQFLVRTKPMPDWIESAAGAVVTKVTVVTEATNSGQVINLASLPRCQKDLITVVTSQLTK